MLSVLRHSLRWFSGSNSYLSLESLKRIPKRDGLLAVSVDQFVQLPSAGHVDGPLRFALSE